MARRRILSPPPGAVSASRGASKEADSSGENVNSESQQMLAIGSLLRKPKIDDKDEQQFHAKVSADRKRLMVLLHERKLQAGEAEACRRNEVASMVQNALKIPIRPVEGDIPTYGGTTIARNATYIAVDDTLAASESLIREYERLDNMSMDMQNEGAEPVVETCNQEIAEMEQQLRMGARVALRNVKKVLGVDGKDGDEEMQEAEGGQTLNYELQKSLRYAERGVKRMVKGLPCDEE